MIILTEKRKLDIILLRYIFTRNSKKLHRGGKLTANKLSTSHIPAKQRRLRLSLIATLLTVAMLIGVNTGVFASEVEESGIPHGYIEIASKTEDLGDGITLEKTLAVEQVRSRAGFSGQRSTMVIHRYSQNGVEKLSANVVVAFSSSTTIDSCKVDSYRFNVKVGSDDKWGIRYPVKEEIVNNADSIQGVYASYTGKYDLYCPPTAHQNWHTMWIKCFSNGELSTSGNEEWSRSSLQDDVVIYDNIAYQFG